VKWVVKLISMRIILNHLIFFLVITHTLHSQCTGDYYLTTQGQVDSFLINNPGCINEVEGLLSINGEDITDLSALLGIRKIHNLSIRQKNIKTLDGLDSLQYIFALGIYHDDITKELEDASALGQLDTIVNLSFYFNDHIQDLEFLKDLKFINRIDIREDGYLRGFNNSFQSYKGVHPRIVIFNNKFENDFSELVNASTDSIRSIGFSGGKNFSFKGMEGVEFIGAFSPVGLEDFSLEGLKNVKSIDVLRFRKNDFSTVDLTYKWDSLKQVKYLQFTELEGLDSLSKLFDHPITVTNNFQIEDNEDLVSVAPLLMADAPMDSLIWYTSGSFDYKVLIENNPDLEICDGYLLCRALQLYPDSVQVLDNGLLCNKDYLLENLLDNCDAILSEGNIITANDIVVYPNPSSASVIIATDVTIDEIEWITASGREVDVVKSISDTYNTSALSSGVYFLKIRSGDDVIIKRWVKM